MKLADSATDVSPDVAVKARILSRSLLATLTSPPTIVASLIYLFSYDGSCGCHMRKTKHNHK